MNGSRLLGAAIPIALAAMLAGPMPAAAQDAERPNTLLLVSDDTGWGDLGPYLGGEGRGMPTPNFDRLADEGKAVIGLRPEIADAVLDAVRAHPLGRDAALIGECVADRPGAVVLDTGFGRRLLGEAEGELLPRIC